MASLLKRYLLFQGSVYYPSTGFGDFVDSFDTLEEAQAHPAYIPEGCEELSDNQYRWSEIVDTHNPEDVSPGMYWDTAQRE